jgi:hypothetical protein
VSFRQAAPTRSVSHRKKASYRWHQLGELISDTNGITLITLDNIQVIEMTRTIVNLSMPLVIQEAENILETYPHHPYRQAFSIPDVRQKLICYVLSRMPGLYTVMDDADQQCANPQSLCSSLDHQRLQIGKLIRQGIQTILNEDADWVNRHIPEDVDPAMTPSNWFG